MTEWKDLEVADVATDTASTERCVLALDLSQRGLVVSTFVSDTGETSGADEISLGGATGESAVSVILDFVAEQLARAPRQVDAIGVGSPGIIDEVGTVRYATVLQWRDVDLAARLQDRFDLPASVGNDIDMTTLAAVRFDDMARRDVILVSLDYSIGMGILVGGRLVIGEHYNAGEIAHVTVVPDGLTCVCGRRGCILAYISAARTATSSQFVSAETKQEAVRAAGEAIGILLAPIASALNLTSVIIEGPSQLITDDMIDAATAVAEQRTLPLLNTQLEVSALRDGTGLVILGAAAHALDALHARDALKNQ